MGRGANRLKIRPRFRLMKADDANVHLIRHLRSEKETGSNCYTAAFFSVVTQRSSPASSCGALRDDTENGCVAD